MERAHYLADRLTAIPGVELLNDRPFGNEVAVRLPISAFEAVDKLVERGYVAGVPLGRYYKDMDDVLLMACTEKNTFEQVGILAEMLGGIL